MNDKRASAASTSGAEARPDGVESDDVGVSAGHEAATDAEHGEERALDASVVATFETELAEARRLADDNWDRYLRAEADLDNLRRRGRRQTDEAVRLLRRELLTKFLDVADNLELALGHAEADPEAVLTGIEGTYRDLTRLLDQEGVSAIDALHAPFDPNVHEAVAIVPTPGTDEEIVVSVERTGYALDGDTLRPARVIVGKPVDAHP